MDSNRMQNEEEVLVMKFPPNSFDSGQNIQNNNWNVWSASISPRSIDGNGKNKINTDLC